MGRVWPQHEHRVRPLNLIVRWLMNVLTRLARFLISVVVLIVTLYFVISLSVTYFKLTGRIIEGQPMYFEMNTPTWANLLTFQAVCVAIVAVALFLRTKLSRRTNESQQSGASAT